MSIDKSKVVFLLGGYDLEMVTIKEILLEEGFKEGENLFDKKLDWGAKLSAYSEVLDANPDKIFYAIELIEDISLPKNYHRIDHHNELSHRDASLLQVLKLLGREPTREHQLIATNDVGHIEAMRCFGATSKEIAEIRQRERTIQGVSAKDEAKAKEEIKAVSKKNGIYIIETSLDSFSPIVDRFEERPLIVYSRSSLTYYGDISHLIDYYKKELDEN